MRCFVRGKENGVSFVPLAQNEFRDRIGKGGNGKGDKEYADCKNVVCAWGKLHEFNQVEK
jgi:hypothetical protein